MTATKTKLSIKPLSDRVVIEPIDESEQTAGGIYIPDTAREKPIKGRVVAVGDGKLLESGQRLPLTVKEGNIVLFSKYGGTEVKLDGVDYKILEESQILGILQD